MSSGVIINNVKIYFSGIYTAELTCTTNLLL